MPKKLFSLFLVGFCLLALRVVLAQEITVVINEVAWMGTAEDSNNEWIELRNLAAEAIDLMGWVLEAEDGAPIIELNGNIEAGGFFLLERSDDETVPSVAADQIYTGSLGNTGEVLVLKNAEGVEIDRADGSGDWAIGGDNETKQTLERGEDGSWGTSEVVGGTPGADSQETGNSTQETRNSTQETEEEECEVECGDGEESEGDQDNQGEENEEEQETEYGTQDTENVEDSLLLSEFIPNPVGLDSENEWIEIFNAGEVGVDLAGYRVSSAQISEGVIGVGEYKYLLAGDPENLESVEGRLKWEGSWAAIANTSGEIVLKDSADEVLDLVSYENLEEGQSLGRAGDGWVVFWHPTPGVENTESNNAPVAVITVQGSGKTSGSCSLSVNLTAEDSIDLDGDSLTYQWDFGNGEISEEPNPGSFKYSTGSYTVTLLATDVLGAISEVSQEFMVSACGGGGSGRRTPKEPEPELEEEVDLPVASQTLADQVEILIVEVAFNSETDFVKVLIVDDGKGGTGVDIGGFYFEDDKNFKEVSEGTFLKTGETLVLEFDSDKEDEKVATNGVLKIYTDKSGLTKTDEQIILKDAGDEVEDAVVWENRNGAWSRGEDKDVEDLVAAGAWSSAEMEAAVDSTLMGKEMVLVRLPSNPDTNSAADWEMQDTANSMQETENSTQDAENSGEARIGSTQVRISELLPNPAGNDKAGEWIELENYGDTPVDLLGWRILRDGKDYEFEENLVLSAGEFFLLPRAISKLTLKNSDGSLVLLSPDGELSSSVHYGKALENVALAWDGQKHVETRVLTPMATNSIIGLGEEGDDEHESAQSAVFNGDLSDQIIISEVLANPEGSDTDDEWIELHNTGSVAINLGNWELDDSEGGSKPFVLDDSIILAPGEYRSFSRDTTKLALNNSGKEEARLFDWQGNLVSHVEISNAPEGISLALDVDGEYRESTRPTPGAQNTFSTQKLSGIVAVVVEDKIVLLNGTEILFGESELTDLARVVLRVGTAVDIFAEEIEGELFLQNFKLNPSSPNQKSKRRRPSTHALTDIFAKAFYMFSRGGI